MRTLLPILFSSLLATTTSLHAKRSLQNNDDIISRTVDLLLPNLTPDERTTVTDTLTSCSNTSISFSSEYTEIVDTLEKCTNTSLSRNAQLSCISSQQTLFESVFSIDFLMDPKFNSTDMEMIKTCADETDDDESMAQATALVLQRFTPCTINITSNLTNIFKDEIKDDNTPTKFLVSTICGQMQSFKDLSALASDTIFPFMKRVVNALTRGNNRR